MNGIIIDTETGSLDPRTGALTEIAAVAFYTEGGRLVEMAHMHNFIIPAPELIVSEQAVRVQGRTIEQVRNPAGGITETDAYLKIAHFVPYWMSWNSRSVNPRTFVGKIWAHNAPFDSGFLHELEMRVNHGVTYFPEPYKAGWSDTKALSIALIGAGKLAPTGGASLDKLADAFHIANTERQNGHSALIDARLALAVLERLFVAAGWLPEFQEGAEA